jgi:acetyl esterase/lipase
MKTEVIKLNEEVSLTTYIYDESNELSNLLKRPAMLILPGGGYEFCSDREAEPIAIAYMAKGYNTFILRYSLKKNSKFPKPLNDAEWALEMIRSKSDEWGVLKDKIACIGFSAGGHLAAMLGSAGRVRPNALLLGYAALLRSPKHGWDYPTPIVDEKTPETFLFHTYMDNVVPIENALYFITEMRKHNIPVEFHLFKTGNHGLSLGNDLVSNNHQYMIDENYTAWFDLSIAWLDKLFNCIKTGK